MPSGKQKRGNCERFILEAFAERYFYVKTALKVCSILPLTELNMEFTFPIHQVAEWQLMAKQFERMRNI